MQIAGGYTGRASLRIISRIKTILEAGKVVWLATPLSYRTHNIYGITRNNVPIDGDFSNRPVTAKIIITAVIAVIIIIGSIFVVSAVFLPGFTGSSESDIVAASDCLKQLPYGKLYVISDPLTGVEYLVYLGKYQDIAITPRYYPNGSLVVSGAGVGV